MDEMSETASVFVFTQKLAGALRRLLQMEYLGQHSRRGESESKLEQKVFHQLFPQLSHCLDRVLRVIMNVLLQRGAGHGGAPGS